MTERTVWLEQAINPDRALSERQVSVPWCTAHDMYPGVWEECVVGERYNDEVCKIEDGVVWKVVDDG